MNAQIRKYSTKDVDMLLAAAAITESAILNKDFLSSKRPAWADPFFENFKTEIDEVINTHLGLDSARELRSATQQVYALQSAALVLLAEVKVQLEEDFKNNKPRREQLLATLGFNTFYAPALKKGDQEALINLLYQFKTNLTLELRQEVTGVGIADNLLLDIVAYADRIKNSDVFQETAKGVKKTVTAESLEAFNRIYYKSISIARIARNFYKNDKPRMDMFSFNKVAKTINRQRTAALPPQ